MSSIHTITHLGSPLTLILILPNLRKDDAHRISYATDAEIAAGNSGRENREPQQAGLQLAQTCNFTLSQADAAALHSTLPDLADNYVGMPLWCDRLTGATWADRIHTAGYLVRLSDGAVLAADAALDDATEYAPLLVGKIHNLPEISAWTLDGGEGPLTLVEDSPPAYRVAINATVAAGTWPSTLAPKWTRVINRADNGRTYDTVGRGREQAIEGREMAFKWGQEADFMLRTRAEIRTLLAFYAASQGTVTALTMPWWFQPADDTAETPHETTVRFASASIELSFSSGATAAVSLAFWQLPWEIAGVEGEEPAQSARAYLYMFSMDVPGGPLVWRYTDWADPITVDEGAGDVTYIPGRIEHDQLVQGYQLDDSGVKLKVANAAVSHPLVMAVKRMLEAPLAITIRVVNPSDTSTVRMRFAGEIGEPTSKGRKVSCDTTVLGGALDTKVPNFYFQQTCNHDFCDAHCGLSDDDWSFTGTLLSADGILVEVTVVTNPPSAALPDDYFANGWISKGTGATYEAREIVRSTDLGSGHQQFVLDRAFRSLADAEGFTFEPNCSGTWDECKTKFGNQINFGGHRHMQTTNPSLPQRDTNTQGGKK